MKSQLRKEDCVFRVLVSLWMLYQRKLTVHLKKINIVEMRLFVKGKSHIIRPLKLSILLVKVVKSNANGEKSSIKWLQYPARPRKLCTSVALVRLSQLTTSFTFYESTLTSFVETSCPKSTTCFNQNSHLLNLAYNYLSRDVYRTILIFS